MRASGVDGTSASRDCALLWIVAAGTVIISSRGGDVGPKVRPSAPMVTFNIRGVGRSAPAASCIEVGFSVTETGPNRIVNAIAGWPMLIRVRMRTRIVGIIARNIFVALLPFITIVLHGFLCWGREKNTSLDQPMTSCAR